MDLNDIIKKLKDKDEELKKLEFKQDQEEMETYMNSDFSSQNINSETGENKPTGTTNKKPSKPQSTQRPGSSGSGSATSGGSGSGQGGTSSGDKGDNQDGSQNGSGGGNSDDNQGGNGVEDGDSSGSQGGESGGNNNKPPVDGDNTAGGENTN
ncbi:hypothetical protein [Clostridium baratii]|uniref:hypothetical protein n=1 Tax=Clostridium baratii TaxID=1561 RepID=UPI00374E663E